MNKEILDKIAKIADHHPELRFTQILFNARISEIILGGELGNFYKDNYYLTDAEIDKRLDDYIKYLEISHEQKEKDREDQQANKSSQEGT